MLNTYPLQLVKVRIWLPLLRFLERSEQEQLQQLQQHRQQLQQTQYSNRNEHASSRHNNQGNSNHMNSSSSNNNKNSLSSLWPIHKWRRRGLRSTIYRTLFHYISFLWSHGPTLQFLLPNVLSCIVLYPLAVKLRFSKPTHAPSALYQAGFSAQMKSEDNLIRRQGNYVPDRPIALYDLFHILMGISLFFLCVSFFSRILPPIPDQVAGHNVARDVRLDAKLSKPNYSGGKSSHSSGKKGSSSSAAASSFLSLSSTSWDSSNAPQVWTERHCPIVSENRIHVHRRVLLWRLLDIWICCGWLPRSDYLAQALGHMSSSERRLPHRLAQDLYPAGITRPLRSDVKFRFWEKQIRDPTSFVWHVWNLIVLPFVLLAVQMLYLNRTYFSMSSWFSKEWTLIGPVEGGIGEAMGSWDPRKKYKKDDLVVYNDYMYQAEINQPEGRPVEPDIRDFFHDHTLYEVGHPSTSRLMAIANAIQLASTMLQALWWVGAFFYTDRTPEGLLIAVAANFLAAHALSTVGNNDCDELSRINDAILGRSDILRPKDVNNKSSSSNNKNRNATTATKTNNHGEE